MDNETGPATPLSTQPKSSSSVKTPTTTTITTQPTAWPSLSSLIKNDFVIYFLNNCRLIYESLMPSIVQQPLVCNNNSIEESVVAAFDIVKNLVNGKHIYSLLLQFAYIHLVRVIDIYRAAAANDRVEGKASREVGKCHITVAIDIYLAAKKDSKGDFPEQSY
jgi:hypothetical protein